MSDRCFIDTNILIYAHESSTGEKHVLAGALLERLWNAGTGVTSTQVLQEFCVNVIRKSKRPVSFAQLRQTVLDLMKWEVVTNAPSSTLRALQIQERFGISFWDALLIHSAEIARAGVLYSEDLSHGQLYGNVLVLNPFDN
jgi:predicted nucleic acid-binding protein